MKYLPGRVYLSFHGHWFIGWCFTVVMDGQEYYYRIVTYDHAYDAKQAMREKVKELNEKE